MKNSSIHNPRKDVAAPSTQNQQWPANRAGTYTPLKLTSTPVRSLPISVSHPEIRSSRHMVVKPIKNIPLRAAQGDDDIMSQEKTL